jgi:uncharacterized protein (DUF2235 family)
MYGLIRKDNESLVPYATRLLMGIDGVNKNTGQSAESVNEYFHVAHGFRAALARPCSVWFVGVWDTVSSVGWIENSLRVPYISNNCLSISAVVGSAEAREKAPVPFGEIIDSVPLPGELVRR